MAVGAVAVVGCGPVALNLLDCVVSSRYPVLLYDLAEPGGDALRERLEIATDRAIADGRMTRDVAEAILDGVDTDLDAIGLDECDVVLEAMQESLHDKGRVLRSLQERMSPGAILASCSRTIPVTRFARRVPRPEQFLAVGLTPPLRESPRVELRTTERTAPGVIEATRYFFRSLGATPHEVRGGSLTGLARAPVGWDATPSSSVGPPLAALADGE